MSGDEWLRVGEAAALLGVSDTKMRELADAGAVMSHRVPGSLHRRISRASVEKLRRETYPDNA